ncbi:hypothetical protein RCZ15_09900 [Capnocytophaga catalasegens]|uniref:Uncharacterized protein n=2 Tax=Capnocytophaga catalasegens TaxID=1004260 RepID=A0AAV5AWF9_9FLAO|nr:hypothetical protein RCZ03_11000 [Capnocytophaga catalasegens]GJM50015.1 hypothetical protein RCZ15_09900 [Capnocytophaga catalasegens]GJM53886.1 hypothetical protein RCZ16_22020 [Capnocytophaga catalasegens]
MNNYVYSQKTWNKSAPIIIIGKDTLIQITTNDVHTLNLLKFRADECEEIQSALLSKIQQDSVLIDNQTALNSSLQKQISLQSNIIENNDIIQQSYKQQIKEIKKKHRKNVYLLSGISVLLGVLTIVR